MVALSGGFTKWAMRIAVWAAACCVAGSAVGDDGLTAEGRGAFWKRLAPDALVVVGAKADPAEREAAGRLADHLRQAGGPVDNLIDDETANTNLERSAGKHLLVVGRPANNRVLARFDSHWTLDRDRYYATSPTPPHKYMATSGYYAAGYLELPANGPACGYIEWDRNPYWHYATNFLESVNRSEDALALPYRQVVRLTGNSAAGVAAVVDAFLNKGLLTGVIIDPANWPKGDGTMWTLSRTEGLAWTGEWPPAWRAAASAGGAREKVSLSWAGWQAVDAALYSGVTSQTGTRPLAMARAKFLTEQGWNVPPYLVKDPGHPMTRSPLFEASLARRASGNEFLLMRFADAAAARTAAGKLETALSRPARRGPHNHDPWDSVKIGGLDWRRSRLGVHIGVVGDVVVMESFDADHTGLALERFAEAMKNETNKK